MSRSYKRNYRTKDHNKGQKELANRKIRRVNKLYPFKGGNYKKLYPTWDICDYNWIWTEKEAIDSWYEEESKHYKGQAWRHKRFGTLEKWLQYWAKCVKRK